MRLIDADAFFEDFPEVRDYEWVSQEYEVDAVPVVRCGECRHNFLKRVRGNAFCELGHAFSQLYDYCSDGERKEDG